MRNKKVFHFKEFSVHHDRSSMKVGTDGVLLGAWTNVEGVKRILDIGTGSGVIALILAQRTSEGTTIDAIDNSKEDFLQAQENFHASHWKHKLRSHHGAVQEFAPSDQYDCIVTNPPYFSRSLEPPDPKRRQVRHTSTLTFEDLLDSSLRLLKPTGHLNLILPVPEGEQFIKLAADKKLNCMRKTFFRTRPGKPVERLLLDFSLAATPCLESEVLLYTENNTHSKEYHSLTKDFYLTF